MPDFILEENSIFDLLKSITSQTEDFEDLVELTHKVINSSVSELLTIEDFYSITKDGEEIASLLYSHYGDGEIRDTIILLDIALGRASTVTGQPSGLEILKQRTKGALIATDRLSTPDWWCTDNMLHLSKPNQFETALRKLFIIEKHEERELKAFCLEMFDNIYFYSPPCFKRLQLNYHEYIGPFITHLSYLNDYAMEDFQNEANDNTIISRAGSHGTEISPESPKTRKNQAAMLERNIVIKGETLCCEWHTKLTATRGRIHFYARAERSDNLKSEIGTRVVIGIITDHLST